MIRSAGEVTRVGELDESSFIEFIHGARADLGAAVESGLFAFEDEVQFPVHHHFSSVKRWLEEMEREWDFVELAPDVVERVEALMAQPGAEIVMREPTRAARFRRP